MTTFCSHPGHLLLAVATSFMGVPEVPGVSFQDMHRTIPELKQAIQSEDAATPAARFENVMRNLCNRQE